MNNVKMLQQQLEQLGSELAGPADFAAMVTARVTAAQPKVRRSTDAVAAGRQAGSTASRRHWRTSAILAASILLCLGVWSLSRPATVYARLLAALAEAKTLHVTGWTRQIQRKWPLEGAPAASAADRWQDGKFPVEMWHWTDGDGRTRSYEKTGPVVLVRSGGDSKEYQEDADLTWIYEGGFSKDRVEEFGGLANYFAALQRPSLKKEELGAREEAGRKIRGQRLTEHDRVQELWIDEATGLPVRLSQSAAGDANPMFELNFKADEAVPTAIANYSPPATKQVRYGGGNHTNDAWLKHVADLSQELQSRPPVERMTVWPRTNNQLFANQWATLTADGKYWIRPLDLDQHFPLTLKNFIQLGVATHDGEQRYGTWRVPKELLEMNFPRTDLVHAADVPWQEWVQFSLGKIGLEFVDKTESQTVWVARHDGRKLRPWQEVKPPVPYVVEGGKEQKGYVKPGVGMTLHPAALQELFAGFNSMIDINDFDADKPMIVDQTGLPAPPQYDAGKHGAPREYREKVVSQFYVATDSPWFVGRESIDMAREWYQKEFGITFTEETRPVTVHVVRRK